MSDFRIIDKDGNTLAPGPVQVIREEWDTDDLGRTVRRILEARLSDGTIASGELVYDMDPRPI